MTFPSPARSVLRTGEVFSFGKLQFIGVMPPSQRGVAEQSEVGGSPWRVRLPQSRRKRRDSSL